MQLIRAIVIAVVIATIADCAPQSQIDYLVKVLRQLEKTRSEEKADIQQIRDYIDNGVVKMELPKESKKLKVQQFAWKNCGPPNAVVLLKNATLAPSPVPVPGNIKYGLTMEFKEVVGAVGKVATTLIVRKKIDGIFVKIPCIGQLGSCTWGNGCAFDPLPNPCPNNFPCHCPFPKGTFSIPVQSAYLNPGTGIPSWITTGDYQIQLSLATNGQTLGCVHVQVSLTKGSDF